MTNLIANVVVFTQAESAEYLARELALAQANDAARLAARLRHDARIDALIAAYQAEKDAIDATYAAGVTLARLAIIDAR